MFKIKEILNHGGSFPFQIDALTEDNRMIYGRYRHGQLTVYIGESGDFSEWAGVEGKMILSKEISQNIDGAMTLAEFKSATKEIIDWPHD